MVRRVVEQVGANDLRPIRICFPRWAFAPILGLIWTASANACEPTVIPATDLIQYSPIVVKGRLIKAQTSSTNPKPAIFRVEQSLRGQIPPGDYRIAEFGPFDCQGKFNRIEVHHPPQDETEIGRDPADNKRYLLVEELSGRTLVTHLGFGYGLRIHHGKASRWSGSLDAVALERYLSGKGPIPLWRERTSN